MFSNWYGAITITKQNTISNLLIWVEVWVFHTMIIKLSIIRNINAAIKVDVKISFIISLFSFYYKSSIVFI